MSFRGFPAIFLLTALIQQVWCAPEHQVHPRILQRIQQIEEARKANCVPLLQADGTGNVVPLRHGSLDPHVMSQPPKIQGREVLAQIGQAVYVREGVPGQVADATVKYKSDQGIQLPAGTPQVAESGFLTDSATIKADSFEDFSRQVVPLLKTLGRYSGVKYRLEDLASHLVGEKKAIIGLWGCAKTEFLYNSEGRKIRRFDGFQPACAKEPVKEFIFHVVRMSRVDWDSSGPVRLDLTVIDRKNQVPQTIEIRSSDLIGAILL